MAYSIKNVREQFPALAQDDFAYFDNAGGSLVLRGVADRIHEHLLYSNVQHGASYSKSAKAASYLKQAEEKMALFINAPRREEIVFGSSATMLIKILAENLVENLSEGDEVIVSIAEHEANFGSWDKLRSKGIRIVPWYYEADSFMLTPATLEPLLTSKTKLVCFTHTSNILGSINPVRDIVALAHERGALTVVDGVAYAPHRHIDVQALDCDFYVFSLYKTYGPHLAVLYGKYDQLLALPGSNHRVVPKDRVPYKFQPGNVNYELAWGSTAILDYFASLGRKGSFPTEQVANAFDMIAEYEAGLCEQLVSYLRQHQNVKIIGIQSSDKERRVPIISFTLEGKNSKDVVGALDGENIGVRWGHFYAVNLIEHLGLAHQNGVIRVSMAHYNTREEVERLINALDPLISR